MPAQPERIELSTLDLSGKDIDDCFELTGVDLSDKASAPKGKFIAAFQYFSLRRSGRDLPPWEEFYANGDLRSGAPLAGDPLGSIDTASGGQTG